MRALPVAEFVGLPGSGKTTSVPQLRDALSSRGVFTLSEVRLRRSPEPLERRGMGARMLRGGWFAWHRARVLIHYRTRATAAVRALARSSRTFRNKRATFRRFAISLDNYDSLRSLRRSEEPASLVIINEGIAQNAFALFVNGPRDAVATRQEIDDFVEGVPVPDFLIFLRAQPKVCLERLHRRIPRGVVRRFEDLDPAALEQAFAVGERVFDQVITGLERRGCTVLEIPADTLALCAPGVWDDVAQRITGTAE